MHENVFLSLQAFTHGGTVTFYELSSVGNNWYWHSKAVGLVKFGLNGQKLHVSSTFTLAGTDLGSAEGALAWGGIQVNGELRIEQGKVGDVATIINGPLLLSSGLVRLVSGTLRQVGPLTAVGASGIVFEPGATLELAAGTVADLSGLTSDFEVPVGATLRIEDGAQLLLPAGKKLVVRGTLDVLSTDQVRYADGTPAPIHFYADHVVAAGRTFQVVPGSVLRFAPGKQLLVDGHTERLGGGALAVLGSIGGQARSGGIRVRPGGFFSSKGGRTEVDGPLVIDRTAGLSLQDGTEFAFAPDDGTTFGGLRVYGFLGAEGTRFTARDTPQKVSDVWTDGWGGIRVEMTNAPSSTQPNANLTGGTIIDGVRGPQSVYSAGGIVTLDNSQIDGGDQDNGPVQDGVYATFGNDQADTFYHGVVRLKNGAVINRHTRHGAYAYQKALVFVENIDTQIKNNGHSGLLARGGTAGVYLSDRAELTDNKYGLVARIDGEAATESSDPNFVPTFPNAFVRGQRDATLYGFFDGVIRAGLSSTSKSAYNNFAAVNEDHARGSAGTTIHALYNYWGQNSGPDPSRVILDATSTFDGCPYLDQNGTPQIACSSQSRTGQVAETASVRGASSTERSGTDEMTSLELALLAAEHQRWSEARTYFAEAITSGGSEAVQALAALPRLVRAAEQAGHTQAVDRTMALLAKRSEPGRPHRARALRALAAAEAARGKAQASLAAADAAFAVSTPDELGAALASRVAALVALGRLDDAEAALAQVGPLPEAALEMVEAAAYDLALRRAGADPGREAAGVQKAVAQAAPASLREAEVPASFGVGSPYPNPATAGVTLPLLLPEAARVTVAVYDVLGRRVLSTTERLSAGEHQVGLDASRLAPGAYVARVTAGTDAVTVRFAVTR